MPRFSRCLRSGPRIRPRNLRFPRKRMLEWSAMNNMRWRAVCVVLLCAAIGCQGHSYQIVGSKRYRDSSRPENNDELILYTIKYGKVTITAHCEVLDPKNRCRELNIGQNYQFKREKSVGDWLSLENPHAVLSIESETVQ